MRRVLPVLLALLALTACTGGDDEAATTNAEDLTSASLGLDWPEVGDTLEPVAPPALPEGFDQSRYDRMVDALTTWAQATTIDADVRAAKDPAAAVAQTLPDAIGSQIERAASQSAAPRLAAANVFDADTELIGAPLVTTAWKAIASDDDGEPALRLQLQTRAAYEVRDGDGPQRVIGVLRVHELVTRPGETGGIGVGFGWQEYGASDCTLALDDALRPDAGAKAARDELVTFAEVGSSDELTMPELPVEDEVDQEYLDRCRRGTT